jgi:hypothetical protein
MEKHRDVKRRNRDGKVTGGDGNVHSKDSRDKETMSVKGMWQGPVTQNDVGIRFRRRNRD